MDNTQSVVRRTIFTLGFISSFVTRTLAYVGLACGGPQTALAQHVAWAMTAANANSAGQSIPINVTAVNPDSRVTTPHATPLVTNAIANDTSVSVPFDPASVALVTLPNNGTVTCGLGSCTYTPNGAFSGGDSYRYQICDISTLAPTCMTKTVSLQVGPNAVNDLVSTEQNTPVNGNVSTNDLYPQDSTFVLAAGPMNGTAKVNLDGAYVYVPNANFSGTDAFTYTLCEPSPYQALCSTASVAVVVDTNALVAIIAYATTVLNTPATTAVLQNVAMPHNGASLNPASVTIMAEAMHGTATCNASGNCTYTPNADYAGADQYTYQVCDNSLPTSTCITGTVNITVRLDVSTTSPDAATTAENARAPTLVVMNHFANPNGAPHDPSSVAPARTSSRY